jgi:hypothetical protein
MKRMVIAHEFKWKDIRDLEVGCGVCSPETTFHHNVRKTIVKVCIVIEKVAAAKYKIYTNFSDKKNKHPAINYHIYSPFDSVQNLIEVTPIYFCDENFLSMFVKNKVIRVMIIYDEKL